MNRRNLTRRISGILAVVSMMLIMIAPGEPRTCCAETGSEGHLPVTVSIPVEHRIKGGKYTGTDDFAFTLTAKDADTPMPAGSAGLTKTVSPEKDGTVDFGEIVYDTPAAYHYTVSRAVTDNRRLRQDDSTYEVVVAALSDGTSETVIRRTGGRKGSSDGKSDEILYEDLYDAPPKTGDSAMILALLSLVILTCTGAMILMITWRRKETDDEEYI